VAVVFVDASCIASVTVINVPDLIMSSSSSSGGNLTVIGLTFAFAQLPVNLLRAGRVFVFEPPPGIRANLLRTFSTLPASRMSRVSVVMFALDAKLYW
jgi:hypothetical protein